MLNQVQGPLLLLMALEMMPWSNELIVNVAQHLVKATEEMSFLSHQRLFVIAECCACSVAFHVC